jgi:hypothetical protein
MAIIISIGFTNAGFAQTPNAAARSQITQPINDANLTALTGNTRPEAKNSANDRGPVADGMPMPHLILQLRRSAAQEQTLHSLIDQLHDPKSPNYHHWLKASEIGERFGPAVSDIATVTAWLEQRGFAVNLVYPNATVIDFSGTAGQVHAAFHTDIHNLLVNDEIRFANMSDPQIPTALAPAIVGVVGLNNIPPHHFQAKPEYSVSASTLLVTPSDLATIYNFNPVFAAGNTGQGQTIYLIEDTDLYSADDWTTFRSTFGLAGYSGASLTTIHPQQTGFQHGVTNCSDPGIISSDSEAILDTEWASAAAPSAAIVVASCSNLLAAVENLTNAANPPAIMSISYGLCEPTSGAANNAAYSAAYQTGVAAGMSIFVASGDSGSDACDRNTSDPQPASHGISVSGLASTPYNVAVGGTDFGDTYTHATGTYWNSTNSPTYGSALSYIPEIPWNGTCGSQLLATHDGYSVTYGALGFCNSSQGAARPPLNSGGGGPSGCATGSLSTSDEVSGTCAGWPKPAWQSVFGNPADGVRDLPDVALFASAGVWNHYYVFCFSDPDNGGKPCTGAPSGWSGGGGTSFAAPIYAGIQALVNNYTGAAQGLPNYVFYQLAAAEYGAGGNNACNSSNGNTIGSSCIFHDVTLGDNDPSCSSGTPNCYAPSGAVGVLSTSTASYAPAYQAQPGWDFSTGIGTVNVYNLVTNWVVAGGGSAGLAVSVVGNGTVTSNLAGIDCTSGTCDASYGGGAMVTLSATPSSGYVFTGWSGACSGITTCTVTVSAAESVTATFAQRLTRTFVSSSGVDSNPCTTAAPCATFAHAFLLANAGGVVAALDAGKYGPLTITGPVTIDGNGWSAITAASGGPGITIAAGTTDAIMLRGVTVDGAGQGGPGIYFTGGGALTVMGCVVRNVGSNGLAVVNNGSTPMSLTVKDSSFINTNTTGAYLASSASGAVTASFVRTEFSGNGVNGLQLDGTQGTGAISVTVTNSVAANNFNSGFEVDSNTGQSVSNLTLTQVQSAGNGTGIAATGANATLWLARSMVAGNEVAYNAQSNAVILNSFGDNSFADNGSGTGALTPVSKQ